MSLDLEDIGREMLRQDAFVRAALVRRGVPFDVAEEIAARAVVLLCASLARGLVIPDEPARRASFIRACLDRTAFALNGKRRRYVDVLMRARVHLVDVADLTEAARGTVTIDGPIEARSELRALPEHLRPLLAAMALDGFTAAAGARALDVDPDAVAVRLVEIRRGMPVLPLIPRPHRRASGEEHRDRARDAGRPRCSARRRRGER